MHIRQFTLTLALLAAFGTPYCIAQDKKDTGKSKIDEKGKDPKDAGPKVPEFKVPTEVLGKSFEQWRKEVHAADPSKREIAMKAILNFGPVKSYDALPDVIAELKKHSFNNPVDFSVRYNGLMVVSTIFKNYPWHEKKEKDIDPKLFKDALTIYKAGLSDSQVMMRIRASQGIIFLGPTAREAIDDIIKVSNDKATWEVRKEGLQTLALIAVDAKGVPYPKAVTEIFSRLEDSSMNVRVTAIGAVVTLARFLSPTDTAAALKKINGRIAIEKEVSLLIYLHNGVMMIQQKIDKKHQDPIVKLMSNPDAGIRVQAMQAVCSWGKDSKPFVPTLTAMIDDPEVGVGAAAIHCLVSLQCTELIPTFEKIIADKKANTILRETAEDAVDALNLFIEMQKKEKSESKDKKDKKDKK